MSGQLGKRSRQRSKKFYGAKKQRVGGLEQLSVGMQGVLITTGDLEKLCVSEAYSLLNEYADELYGPEHMTSPDNSDLDDEARSQNDSCRGTVDVEAEVAKEIERLKGRDKDGRSRKRRFQVVATGAKHVVFVRCLEEVDPCQLVHHMLTDIANGGVKKSRFCQRILPVTKVCYASVKDLERQADSVLYPHFHSDSLVIHKFAVNYKARNNNDVKRDDIIKLMASMVVKNGDFDHQVDLNNPDLTIVVEIIKNLCCLSVIKDFVKLKKYNLQSLVSPEPQKSDEPATSSDQGRANLATGEDAVDTADTCDLTDSINTAEGDVNKTIVSATGNSDSITAASAESSQKLESCDAEPTACSCPVVTEASSSPAVDGTTECTMRSRDQNKDDQKQ